MAEHHADHPSFNHPAPLGLLYGVFVTLIALTILTVVVSGLGLPPAIAFPAAMIIATAKAFLVCAFFMHMWWDKSFNILVFLSSMFFVSLFIGLTLTDTSEYQNSIDLFPRQDVEVATPAK